MTISIGGLGPHPKSDFGETNVDQVTSRPDNKTSPETVAAPAHETTTLLAGAASIAALTKVAMNGDDTRTSKIAQLRHDIANGAYQLEPAKIADALLAEWL